MKKDYIKRIDKNCAHCGILMQGVTSKRTLCFTCLAEKKKKDRMERYYNQKEKPKKVGRPLGNTKEEIVRDHRLYKCPVCGSNSEQIGLHYIGCMNPSCDHVFKRDKNL